MPQFVWVMAEGQFVWALAEVLNVVGNVTWFSNETNFGEICRFELRSL